MNHRLMILAAALVAAPSLAASPAQAQSPVGSNTESSLVGVGVELDDLFNTLLGFDTTGGVYINPVNLYVPINVTPNLRIEPDVGFFRFASNSETRTDEDVFVARAEDTVTAVRLGVGVFYMFQPAEKTNLYAGGRLGVMRISQYEYSEIDAGPTDVVTETTTTRNNLALGLGGGGEYYLSSNFSVGGEARVDFINIGEPTIQDDEGNEPDEGETRTVESNTILTPAASVFIRFYFL